MKILFICGTKNQTTQMHKIASELPEFNSYFTPYYCNAPLRWAADGGMLDFTILGRTRKEECLRYLEEQSLPIDCYGEARNYDLVVTCADLIIPRNIKSAPIILVQEGMTDPEGFMYHAVKTLPFLPRWLASTATMGLSDRYVKFCVASDGYRELFTSKGVDPSKIAVTGIPNFDDCKRFLHNSFPHRNYVLVCTSDSRETFRYENRKRTIENALQIANGRKLIVKLHPNEIAERRIAEVHRYAPDALVFSSGNTEEMIANCDVLITEYSSTVYVGMALGKEVYSKFPQEHLRQLLPLQHGQAAENIAHVCRDVLYSSYRKLPSMSKLAV